MKIVLKYIGLVLLVIVLVVVLFFGYLTVFEYRPDEVEEIATATRTSDRLIDKKEIRIVTMNTGYAGLDKSTDFFMDAGSGVNSESKELVQANLAGIDSILKSLNGDFYILQEVDADSSRSYHLDEVNYYLSDMENRDFALNYSCNWVPYPLPMIGKVRSGIETISNYSLSAAYRYSLPCSFSWPVRTANLKRCLTTSYFPIEGSDKQLVIVNFHLEAYDAGEGKKAQTRVLWEILEAEYEKGNYVIAGGDFNQAFPGAEINYDVEEGIWIPGVLEESEIREGWSLNHDLTGPSCRSLDKPYTDPENHEVYNIDGFITSPNVTVKSTFVVDYQFEYSDHNPVVMDIVLD